MTLIHNPLDLALGTRQVCIAIGVFDGVHLGHQQEAMSIVITFDCHPNTVVAQDRAPPLIYSLPQKLRAIATLGVDTTLLIHFDEPFSKQSGEQFIRDLARDCQRIHSICVGSSFTFGHKRSGDVAVLKILGRELDFMVHGLAAVSLDGEIVSSTRIREAIRNGQLDFASQMLGRGYSLAGLVRAGDQLGRQLGFPTANIDTTGLVLPPTGVYAIHATIGGKTYRAALNIGCRPTLTSETPQLRVEAHLLNFTGDIYGQEMEIAFVQKLRDEKKFPSTEALKAQIALDVIAASKRFTDPSSGVTD